MGPRVRQRGDGHSGPLRWAARERGPTYSGPESDGPRRWATRAGRSNEALRRASNQFLCRHNAVILPIAGRTHVPREDTATQDDRQLLALNVGHNIRSTDNYIYSTISMQKVYFFAWNLCAPDNLCENRQSYFLARKKTRPATTKTAARFLIKIVVNIVVNLAPNITARKYRRRQSASVCSVSMSDKIGNRRIVSERWNCNKNGEGISW